MQDKIIAIETGNLLDFMRPGILALIDYSNRRAYLSDALCLSDNLMRQLKLIHRGQHTVQKEDMAGYKAYALKFVDDPKQLKYAYADACQTLHAMGFKVISRHIKYKVKEVIQPNFRSMGNRYLLYVYLYCQRKPVKLLGVFNHSREAEEFMNLNYPNRRINGMNVVVSNNQLTDLYLDSYREQEYVRLMGL